jgi:hypothetical protein
MGKRLIKGIIAGLIIDDLKVAPHHHPFSLDIPLSIR